MKKQNYIATDEHNTAIIHLSSIVTRVIKSLENPPLSKRAVEKKPTIAHANQHCKTIKQAPKRNLKGGIVRTLSQTDAEDVAAMIQLCLTETQSFIPASANSSRVFTIQKTKGGYYTRGGFYCSPEKMALPYNDGKKSHETAWHYIFSRCRKMLNFSNSFHKITGELDALPPETLDKVCPSSTYRFGDTYSKDELGKKGTYLYERHISPRRDALAKQARFYKRAIHAAFLADESRKKKANYRTAKAYLRASVQALNYGGHGLDPMADNTRHERKKTMLEYLKTGIAELSRQNQVSLDDLALIPNFVHA